MIGPQARLRDVRCFSWRAVDGSGPAAWSMFNPDDDQLPTQITRAQA
jgi:hypothetical protein